MPKNLELGCGTWIRPGLEEFEHHGFIKHSDFISYAHDLNITPWPWSNNEWDHIYAIDVMQMLDIKIIDWLTEVHRVLKPGGIFLLRLPAFDNPEAWRDPVDKRVYHPDSMYYFDPSHELYQKFSLAYWKNIPQFKVTFIDKRAGNFVYQMIKI